MKFINFFTYFHQKGIDQIHEISVQKDSLLNQVAGVTIGDVNSSHHQAVEIIADDLVASARAEEPIIEAMEWKHPEHHSFYLGVQVKVLHHLLVCSGK